MFAIRTRLPLLAGVRSVATTSTLRSVPVATTKGDAFSLAKQGSNQLSLETPQNGVEYALSTMDKVVNWARVGSIWPMVSLPSSHTTRTKLERILMILNRLLDWLVVLWR